MEAKTYRFALDDAPASDHMAGLLVGLAHWLHDCERRMSDARTQSDRSYWKGKRDGFRQTIETIKDSTSYREDE